VPVRSGDTFLLTGGPVPTPHLWVVLWGPAGPADAYLAVMLTSLRSHSDRSCILNPGDHPFVRHTTSVSYRDVLRWTDERLAQLVADGVAKPRQPVSATVLERMRAAFFQSAHTPNAMVEMAVDDFGATAAGAGEDSD
jgi:hypothetical protein